MSWIWLRINQLQRSAGTMTGQQWYVTYLDPGYLPTHRRPSRMPLPAFRHQWDGSSVQIVGFH
jgi:hypothetical protein